MTPDVMTDATVIDESPTEAAIAAHEREQPTPIRQGFNPFDAAAIMLGRVAEHMKSHPRGGDLDDKIAFANACANYGSAIAARDMLLLSMQDRAERQAATAEIVGFTDEKVAEAALEEQDVSETAPIELSPAAAFVNGGPA